MVGGLLTAWLPRCIEEDLSDAIRRTWPPRVGGFSVAEAVGSARRVELADLADDDKVQHVGDAIRVDRRYIDQILREHRDPDEVRALALLFFFHELLHVPQGLREKKKVVGLRSAGGEHALLGLDLAADHGAALTVHHARPQWSLCWLRDVQGRSLRDWPVQPTHAPQARARKAARLVSLRVDFLLRSGGTRAHAVGEGYALAQYASTGRSTFAVLTSGPPPEVLGKAVELSARDAKTLRGAADAGRGDDLAQLDGVLTRLLGAAGLLDGQDERAGAGGER